MDTPVEKRNPYLAEDTPELATFPYVNGGLFSDEDIEIPPFTDEIRELLLNKASTGFDWSEISPIIFGAVFESTLNPETRRSGGMHHTSMEDFIDYTALVVGTLGYKVFEPSDPKASPIDSSNPLLYMEYKGYKATGQRTAEGFVVFKGSMLNPETTKSCPRNVLRTREKYKDKISSTYELLVDVPMSSPSAAAGLVGGAALNGNALWHDADGVSLNQEEG
ncbi:MAG: DUF4357 domain-containing protein [Clostridiales bacterium]|nr:DUF4357 domain-containing protein [Clostridiales bacterium]